MSLLIKKWKIATKILQIETENFTENSKLEQIILKKLFFNNTKAWNSHNLF